MKHMQCSLITVSLTLLVLRAATVTMWYDVNTQVMIFITYAICYSVYAMLYKNNSLLIIYLRSQYESRNLYWLALYELHEKMYVLWCSLEVYWEMKLALKAGLKKR